MKKKRLVFGGLFLLSIACANLHDIPEEPQKLESSWGILETKGTVVLDSLESVRSLQTSEMALMLTMISYRDSVFVLELTDAELDSLGITTMTRESVNRYINKLNYGTND